MDCENDYVVYLSHSQIKTLSKIENISLKGISRA